jgi:hypothetical protein
MGRSLTRLSQLLYTTMPAQQKERERLPPPQQQQQQQQQSQQSCQQLYTNSPDERQLNSRPGRLSKRSTQHSVPHGVDVGR